MRKKNFENKELEIKNNNFQSKKMLMQVSYL